MLFPKENFCGDVFTNVYSRMDHKADHGFAMASTHCTGVIRLWPETWVGCALHLSFLESVLGRSCRILSKNLFSCERLDFNRIYTQKVNVSTNKKVCDRKQTARTIRDVSWIFFVPQRRFMDPVKISLKWSD